MASDSGVYWIHGKPGSGKSTLMKYLSHSVRPQHHYAISDPKWRPEFAVAAKPKFATCSTQAAFYYNHTEPPRSATSILRFLLHQLLSDHPWLLEYVLPEFQQSYHLDVDVASPLADTILHLAKHEPMYIFLDCLDEFPPAVRDKLTDELLNRLVHVHEQDLLSVRPHCSCGHRTTQLKVCVSTRSKRDILWPVEHLDLSTGDAGDGLIQDAYIELDRTWGVSTRSTQYHCVLRSTLEDLVFLPNTLGPFIWLKIVANLQLSRHGAITSQMALSLIDFPTVGDELFQYILDSVEQQCYSTTMTSRAILMWIALAERPLTVLELQEALCLGAALDHRRRPIWGESIWKSDWVPSLCSTLLAEDDAMRTGSFSRKSISGVVLSVNALGIFETIDDTIHLVHRTVREFLDKEFLQDRFQYAQKEIARTCISYLSIYKDPRDERNNSLPLLSYCATYWHEHHLRGQLRLDRNLTNPKSRLLHAWFPTWWQHQSETEHDLKIFPAYPTEGIILAFLGEQKVIDSLLTRNLMDVDQCTRDGELWTPLMAAAWSGHYQLVELLLSRRDNDSANPVHDTRALIHAIERRHTTTAQTLLMSLVHPATGLKVLNAWVTPGETAPLTAAIKSGNLSQVELLLDLGADVNSCDRHGESALRGALDDGSFQVVELLLRKGADLTSPTSWASFIAHPLASRIWKLLLHAGIRIQTLDSSGDTPFHAAAEGVFDESNIEHQLLEPAHDVEFVELHDRHGKAPLHRALRSGRIQLIQDLYQRMSIAFRSDSEAFLAACEASHPDVVKFFLDIGTSPNTSRDGKYAIHHVFTDESRIGSGAAFGSTPHGVDRASVLRLLIERGASLNQKDGNGDTALHLAVRKIERQSVITLLDLGSAVNLMNREGCTALDVAAKHGNIDLTSHILDAKALISNVSWRNALESGDTLVIRRLLDKVMSFPGSDSTEKFAPGLSCAEDLSPNPKDLLEYFVTCGRYAPRFASAIEHLQYLGIRRPHRLSIGTKVTSSVINSFKVRWESITNTQWIWWPLMPCIQPLRPSEAWVRWGCEEVRMWIKFSSLLLNIRLSLLSLLMKLTVQVRL